jgi:hypothetical protein
MKETAIEWLVDELGLVEYEGLQQPEWIKHLIEQAKEMEKQQIIDAWTDGKYCNTIGNEINYEDGEQYYNETFNK